MPDLGQKCEETVSPAVASDGDQDSGTKVPKAEPESEVMETEETKTNSKVAAAPEKHGPGGGGGGKKPAVKNTRNDYDLIGKKDNESFLFKAAAPSTQMPGHTGFLTFATLYPS